MNTKKGFVSILIILLGLVVIGGAYYLYSKNNIKDVSEDSQVFVMSGIWKFEEASKEPNVNGITTPAWEYTLSIDEQDDTKGTLYVDGYQTLTRLNVRIEKLNDSANIILDSYGKDNQFEPYKKGDVLISVFPDSDRNLMSIDWYKMQPNIEGSKTNAMFMRQKEISTNKKDTEENKIDKTTLTIEDGGHWVYVKDFFENNGKYYLSFDKYEVGECPEDGNLHPTPCLFNDNPLIRTIEINPDARLNLHKSIDGVREWQIFNPAQLMSYLKSNSDYVSKENINDGNYVDSLYGKIYGNSVRIDTQNNKIINVEVAFPS